MSLFLSVAIYVILWWLAFFVMLPLGARSPHEGDEATVPGVERGAPKVANLGKKALFAAAIAAALWLFVAWGVSVDLIGMRR